MGRARTNPNFLSDDEVLRERKRTEDFVRSITGVSPKSKEVQRVVKTGYLKQTITNKQSRLFKTRKSIKFVGETSNFVVQFNYSDKSIQLYGKDFFIGKAFKLKFKVSETKTIINLLSQATNALANNYLNRIGEAFDFVVDADGEEKYVILYDKKEDLPIKLGINQHEVAEIINLLIRARSYF